MQALEGGFTSSTFSFNLPAPRGASAEASAGLILSQSWGSARG